MFALRCNARISRRRRQRVSVPYKERSNQSVDGADWNGKESNYQKVFVFFKMLIPGLFQSFERIFTTNKHLDANLIILKITSDKVD